MLKKEIQYEDLDGNQVKDTFYFNFNKAELAKLQLKYEALGGMQAHFQKIMREKDVEAITAAFEYIILGSIGEKAADGKRFEKKDGAVGAWFKETDAYSVLFMELVSGGGQGFQDFIQGALPNNLQQQLVEQNVLSDRIAEATERIQNGDVELQQRLRARVEEIVDKKSVTTDLRPDWVRENRPPNREELLAMSPEEYDDWFKRQQNP
jgi:hypothetical protein